MADKKLDSVIKIDGESYDVVAAKIAQPLKINVEKENNTTETYIYDGSTADGKHTELTITKVKDAEHARVADSVKNKLIITAGNGQKVEFDGSKELSINASVADKTKAALTITTINNGEENTTEFDGSVPAQITVGDANKIKVNMDSSQSAYATITISKNDPVGGAVGDIWFKY